MSGRSVPPESFYGPVPGTQSSVLPRSVENAYQKSIMPKKPNSVLTASRCKQRREAPPSLLPTFQNAKASGNFRYHARDFNGIDDKFDLVLTFDTKAAKLIIGGRGKPPCFVGFQHIESVDVFSFQKYARPTEEARCFVMITTSLGKIGYEFEKMVTSTDLKPVTTKVLKSIKTSQTHLPRKPISVEDSAFSAGWKVSTQKLFSPGCRPFKDEAPSALDAALDDSAESDEKNTQPRLFRRGTSKPIARKKALGTRLAGIAKNGVQAVTRGFKEVVKSIAGLGTPPPVRKSPRLACVIPSSVFSIVHFSKMLIHQTSLHEPLRIKVNVDGCKIGDTSVYCTYTAPGCSVKKTDGIMFPSSCIILRDDMARCKPGQYLNDTLIGYWMRKWYQDQTFDLKEQIFFFNTFFYPQLAKRSKTMKKKKEPEKLADAYKAVQRWTKNHDVFKYHYLFIPINLHSHWLLCVISNPKAVGGLPGGSTKGIESLVQSDFKSEVPYPALLFFDSLGNHSSQGTIAKNLRNWLHREWLNRRKAPTVKPEKVFKVNQVQVPQQGNGSDCGLFVLLYTTKFCERIIEKGDHFIHSEYKKYFGCNWFPPKESTRLRQNIANSLRELKKTFTPAEKEDESSDDSDLEVVMTKADESSESSRSGAPKKDTAVFGELAVSEPVAEQAFAEPVAEQAGAEPVAEQVVAEPVAEQAGAEPVAEQVVAEPVAEQAEAEPVAEQVVAEPVAEQAEAEPVAEQAEAEPVVAAPTAQKSYVRVASAPVILQAEMGSGMVISPHSDTFTHEVELENDAVTESRGNDGKPLKEPIEIEDTDYGSAAQVAAKTFDDSMDVEECGSGALLPKTTLEENFDDSMDVEDTPRPPTVAANEEDSDDSIECVSTTRVTANEDKRDDDATESAADSGGVGPPFAQTSFRDSDDDDNSDSSARGGNDDFQFPTSSQDSVDFEQARKPLKQPPLSKRQKRSADLISDGSSEISIAKPAAPPPPKKRRRPNVEVADGDEYRAPPPKEPASPSDSDSSVAVVENSSGPSSPIGTDKTNLFHSDSDDQSSEFEEKTFRKQNSRVKRQKEKQRKQKSAKKKQAPPKMSSCSPFRKDSSFNPSSQKRKPRRKGKKQGTLTQQMLGGKAAQKRNEFW